MKTSPWLIATVAVILAAGCGDGDDTDWASILAPKTRYLQVAGTYTGRAYFYYPVYADPLDFVMDPPGPRQLWRHGALDGYGRAIIVQSGDQVTMKNGSLTFEDESSGEDWELILPTVTGTIDRRGGITITATDRTGVQTFSATRIRPGPRRECGVFALTVQSLQFHVVVPYANRVSFYERFRTTHNPRCGRVTLDIQAALDRR